MVTLNNATLLPCYMFTLVIRLTWRRA